VLSESCNKADRAVRLASKKNISGAAILLCHDDMRSIVMDESKSAVSKLMHKSIQFAQGVVIQDLYAVTSIRLHCVYRATTPDGTDVIQNK
ncbi:MAG: hypothetical protein LPH21_16420, partial [Shewanella sp.]|nr:hypothetical protein [Shewanella sp.]